MAEVKPLYSTCVAVLGFICFVVGATAVGIPMWGYFDTPGTSLASGCGMRTRSPIHFPSRCTKRKTERSTSGASFSLQRQRASFSYINLYMCSITLWKSSRNHNIFTILYTGLTIIWRPTLSKLGAKSI